VRCGNLFRKEAWFTSLVTVLRARMSAKLLTKKLKKREKERKRDHHLMLLYVTEA
jgi:hypothetical protein